MVSIIIPVYNVRQYIDKCLESIVAQTYRDLEVILVDDSSTDGSGDRCEWWSRQDMRIRCIHKENGGPGPARNLGVREARGEWLFFVDSDDWIEDNTLELLVDKVVSSDADIVICNANLITMDADGVQRITPYKIQTVIEDASSPRENEEIIYRTDTAVWGKLMRMSYYRGLGIEMPAHPYEDTSVAPVILAGAKRIACVRDCLYNYRQHRRGSITGNAKNVIYIGMSIREVAENADGLGVLEEFRDAFMKYSRWMIRSIDYHLNASPEREEARAKYYDAVMTECRKVMDTYYPGWDSVSRLNYVVWGSYNVRSMTAKLLLNMSHMIDHYGFSSIVSVESEDQTGKKPLVIGERSIVHDNKFRESMLKKEMGQAFVKQIETESERADYLILDLLEERCDLSEYKGRLFTRSEAFDEAVIEGKEQFVPVDRLGYSLEQWQEKCMAFIACIQERYPAQRVILVRNRLCEAYGTMEQRSFYTDVDRIRKINDLLERYYDFFIAHFPGIKVVTCREELMYTDQDYVYGVFPYHMNELAYHDAAEQMEAYIKEQDQ